MAQVWFRRGSGVVRARFRRGACATNGTRMLVGTMACLSGVVQPWFRVGSGLVQALLRRDSSAACARPEKAHCK
eukprot:6723245-Pyramimonas_sp.AAC.1